MYDLINDIFRVIINPQKGVFEIYGKWSTPECFEQLELIPLCTVNVYEEWTQADNGSKRINIYYSTEPKPDTNTKLNGYWVCDNGNLLYPVSHHYCLILNIQDSNNLGILSFKGLESKDSRRWEDLMMRTPIERNGVKFMPPRYFHSYIANFIINKGRHSISFSVKDEVGSEGLIIQCRKIVSDLIVESFSKDALFKYT
jgi:hypothetical protein